MPPQNLDFEGAYDGQFLEIFPVFFKQVYNFEGLSIVEKNKIEKKNFFHRKYPKLKILF